MRTPGDRTATVLRALQLRGPLDTREMARFLGLTPEITGQVLHALSKAGAIRKLAAGVPGRFSEKPAIWASNAPIHHA